REFSAAYALCTQAIHLNPTSPTLYSNRSAALLSMNKLPLALNDADQAIKLDPTWPKAYRRKASVLEA
ncbi:At1g04190-like protein, partial [Tuber borchii]